MTSTTALVLGVLLLAGAVAAIAYVLLGSTAPRISKDRRRGGPATPSEPLLRRVYAVFVHGVDVVLRQGGWVPFRASELEGAGVHRPPNVVLSWILIGSVGAFLAGSVVLGGLFGGLVAAAAVPLMAKMVLKSRTKKRQRRFEGQLDSTLRIISSAMRAGQSLPMALAGVAKDSEAPMSEELHRVVNENRVGRDLVEAMMESADRMQSEDFRWFAEAVAVQRDTGGNLNDIIDVVAETIRDRSEIRAKVDAYASEGKASMWVLMALPVALAILYMIIRPGYMDPLVETTVGRILFGSSVILYGLGYMWMRNIVDIKV